MNPSDEQIAFMYGEGMSIRDIAGAFGLSKQQITSSLSRTGTVRRTKREAALTPAARVKSGQPDPKTEREIVDLYVSGQSMRAIAENLGMAWETVKKILERRHVAVRSQRTPVEIERRAVEMYQAGHSLVDIGRELGMTGSGVRHILIRHHEPRRPARMFGGGDAAAEENPVSGGLICMGRDVSFVLRSRRELAAKKRDGLLYDASGIFWPACSLLVMPFEQGEDEVDDGKDYFGKKTPVFQGWVTLPPRHFRGWRELGEIKDVFYDRAGKHEGYFRHEFNKPRGLWRVIWPFKRGAREPAVLYERRGLYRIELPEGCLVDDRGFVVP